MKTTQVVTVHPNDGSLLISIGKGYYIRGQVYWDDDSFTTNEFLKIAIIDESERAIEVLLLIAVSDHYERIGYGDITIEPLNNPEYYPNLWIQQGESSRTVYREIEPLLNEDTWKADEERLRACFGDLDNYNWWEDVFKEEYITLG